MHGEVRRRLGRSTLEVYYRERRVGLVGGSLRERATLPERALFRNQVNMTPVDDLAE